MLNEVWPILIGALREGYAEGKAQTKLRRLQSAHKATRSRPAPTEERGLGIEGWLGLMVFLGVVGGLAYARAVLP
jgi:hypothetical protein